MNLTITQDMDKAIQVMRSTAEWRTKVGKKYSKWWDLKNLNKEFLLQYAKPEHFYVAIIKDKPAAAIIIQEKASCQAWELVSKDSASALYLDWICVDPEFMNKGLIKLLIDFAEILAKENKIKSLRMDSDADKPEWINFITKDLGFTLAAIEAEDYRSEE